MKKRALLPKLPMQLSAIPKWGAFDGRDFEWIGFFLTCHLVVEYHLDLYLGVLNNFIPWNKAKLTFFQKTTLVSRAPYWKLHRSYRS